MTTDIQGVFEDLCSSLPVGRKEFLHVSAWMMDGKWAVSFSARSGGAVGVGDTMLDAARDSARNFRRST